MAYDIHDINRNFAHHVPTADKIEQFKRIRQKSIQLAEIILIECPDSAEKTLAFRKLEEVVMWANASIARNE